MSSRKEQKMRHKEKKLAKVLQEMDGKVILVEGKRDRAALANIGFDKVMTINRRPEEVAQSLEGEEEAVLLMDFDDAGEELLRRTEEALLSYNIKPDVESRRALRSVLGVTFFEDLHRLKKEFETELEGGSDGKDIHRYGKVSCLCRHGDRRNGGEARRCRCGFRAD